MTIEALTPIDAIQAAEIRNPAPLDVNVDAVLNKVTMQSVAAPGSVSYAPVTTGDAVSNETLNRTAESLALDINAKFGSFATAITAALADAGSDLSEQVGAINAVLEELKTEVNAALNDVRVKETQQTADITAAVNTRVVGLDGNILKLKTFAEGLEGKINALNETFATDADLAEKVQAINALIGSLRDTDLDFLTAVDSVIDEVNAMRRLQQKEIIVASSTGVYDFVTATEGMGEFNAAGDYSVTAQVVNNDKAIAHVYDKTRDGFKIAIKSQGVHFAPQPVDCAVASVRVSVLVSYDKRNPMSFNVDTLKGAFVSGNGTDMNPVGA